jgi:LEA14-like dessication related protein
MWNYILKTFNINNMEKTLCFAVFLMAAALFLTCKNTPPSRSGAASSLTFESIEAANPNHLNLSFILKIENRFPFDGKAKAESRHVEINGQEANSGISLTSPSEFPLKAASTAFFPLKLDLDMATLAAEGIEPADDYRVNLTIDLDLSFDDAPSVRTRVSCLAVFPGVQAPEFTVTAIAILRAELINTIFKVTININNPNSFPVTLSSLNYELYGNGLLWADGTEKNVLQIPEKSSAGTNLFLMMNFINMRRDLLDRIIRLQDVNYRFTGNARVAAGVDYLPVFNTVFDLSGYSAVLDE